MFHTWWLISGASLVAAAALAGRLTNGTFLGLLLDGRGRYSLNHFQVLMWTLLVLSTWLGILIPFFDVERLRIPSELLVLMGISLGSASAAGAIKSAKDASGASVRRMGTFTLADGTQIQRKPFLRQMLLEEEGFTADEVINVTKFQNYVFTLVAGFTYVGLMFKAEGFPVLPEELVWLIGISHAGYIAGKLPDKK